MALSIREATAKRLLGDLCSPCVTVTSVTNLETLVHDNEWLLTTPLVVKPDVLLKRRGKSGLLKLNCSFQEAKTFLQQNLNTEKTVEGVTGVFDCFIIEPFFPHTEDNEFYISIRTLRNSDEILFSTKGGIHVGDVEEHAKSVHVPLLADNEAAQVNSAPLLVDLPANHPARNVLPSFIQNLYNKFVQHHFAFLELNPISLNTTNNTMQVLDAAAKLDHTAEYLLSQHYKKYQVEFPSPFGRTLTSEELYIRDLDSKTGSSLKLTLLNPKGRVWTLIAGGGASVVYTDAICDNAHYAHELANYGEYSGAPSEITTYEYAKTILRLMTDKDAYHEKGKILLIGGGIANFTSVADTFKGIIRALREYSKLLVENGVRIYVRRGGPNYQDGLKMMRELSKEICIPIKVYGPETYITSIVNIAFKDDGCPISKEAGEKSDIEEKGDRCRGDKGREKGSLPSTWHDTDKADIEKLEKLHIEDSAMKQQPSIGTGSMKDLMALEPKIMEDLDISLHNIRTYFSPSSQCFVFGLQERTVQEMLDFDYISNRKTPSVACIIYEFSVSHMRPFYFGTDEIFLPVLSSLQEAYEKFPQVDILINFASLRSAYNITKTALTALPSIKTICIIAEGIPERMTRELIQLSIEKKVTIIGPATVGCIKPKAFRLGNTGGRLENIMNSKLYRNGSVGLVTKSGGMLNEMNNILSQITDGCYEAIAVGGDRFCGSNMLDHVLRFEKDDNVKMIVLLGELGGIAEHNVAKALQMGLIKKPIVAYCIGVCADQFKTEVSFGHAGAWAGSADERAASKNASLKKSGAVVPENFESFGKCIYQVYEGLVSKGIVIERVEEDIPRVPLDFAWAKKLGLVRKPKCFVSTISDDRGEELVYAGYTISNILNTSMGVGGVISLLWFKRPLPDYCYKYFETILILTADHGPAVCGAHNTIVTTRAGKDLVSSLIAGLCTIGDRFGGACDKSAQQFLHAYDNGMSPESFVSSMKSKNELIMGIGHKIKSIHNPDMRVELLKKFCKENFTKTNLIDYALSVEALTTKKKDTLILNVDGLMGVSFVDLLFNCGSFSEKEAREYINNGCVNGMFVLGRSIGFIGHYLDQKRLKQGLYRHDADDIAYVLPELNQ